MPSRIVVFGSGGVGGFFGGRLADAGLDVTFIARGAHLEAMQRQGLRIESPTGTMHLPRVHATDRIESIAPPDVVLFTVKMYDAKDARDALRALVGPDTLVIPLQNGVETVEWLAQAVGAEHVVGGTAYVFASIEQPGVIRHSARGQLIVGETTGEVTPRLERFRDACATAAIDVTISPQIEIDIWTKFVDLSVFSGMTAVTRLPLGALCDDADLFAMYQAALLEAIAVAHARGVALPHDVFDRILATVRDAPASSIASMLRDLDAGHPLELPWLSGAVVRMGRELDVQTPIHRFISAVLGPYVSGPPPDRPRMRSKSATVTPWRPHAVEAGPKGTGVTS